MFCTIEIKDWLVSQTFFFFVAASVFSGYFIYIGLVMHLFLLEVRQFRLPDHVISLVDVLR